MTRAAIEVLIEEEVRPFLKRLTISNLKSQQVLQALGTFQRMCEPKATAAERGRLARKPSFDDALLLFEILVEATDDGREALAEWQATARLRSAPRPAAASEAKPRVRRRRRRRPAV